MPEFIQPTVDPAWTVREHGYDPLRERGIESRFAIGNGFLGVRGVPSISADKVCVSWPRTYVSGLFDTPASLPHILSLVSVPDWVAVSILVDGVPLLRVAADMDLHSRTLDMKRGMLFCSWRCAIAGSPIVAVRSVRLVSLADRRMGLELIEIDCGAEADISLEAAGASADPCLKPTKVTRGQGRWSIEETGKGIAMATEASLRLDGGEQAPATPDGETWLWRWRSEAGQVATLERMVSFARRDEKDGDALPRALKAQAAARAIGSDGIIGRHEAAWRERWHCSDVAIGSDPVAQHALRFAIYHLNSAANPEDEQVSIGARALTGEDYHGHVFWDTEIFLLPFYTLTWPAAARALLIYRYHGLDGARAKAIRMGWRGAFYAWESASSGDETTPDYGISADGTLVKILSGQEEEHISADVAYAVWHYWQATGDDGFLRDAGAEILFETARFWASRAQLETDGKSHIRGVEGPDEYHEHIDDNAYTNVMARWNIRRALEIVALLRLRWPACWTALARRLTLVDAELVSWTKVAGSIATGREAASGLVEQFAGYFELNEIDLASYAGRTSAMDVLLGRDQTQRSQVIKQADVVALLALVPEEFDEKSRLDNFNYYERRCDHGSSLSRAMHAQVAARVGETTLAMRYFKEAASIDLADTSWRSAGGVHIATLGGLWQAAVFGFAGMSIQEQGVAFDPRLPESWNSLQFRVQWRGRTLDIRIEQVSRRLLATLEDGETMTVIVAGVSYSVFRGPALSIELSSVEPEDVPGLAPCRTA
ncbi:glycoside hydrolase family 65 protein [Lichenifustis flavocetrariae]|uniref:Glycoside hydrolase family 65 protein n=1 Tax=Lichenifustis flavocetrariae TaxID=2949735 RepID=A0AA42CM32_9HYPH|nr:glycosyl hydrolase family 65 protein [Lichenifustis flavocetrariae]MCW6512138.1 glycoside hydrolase family 65 protein [Lichenifustis flavocetrariae]